MNLLTATGITKEYTDRKLLLNADFSIEEGEKVGVIGINGTGKSTLLRLAAFVEEPDEGNITKGNSVHICYLPQNPDFNPEDTIYEYVCRINHISSQLQSIEGEAKTVLNRLGFDDYELKMGILSGGQQKRVALAAALLTKSELLILDEPTNHLDNDMILWLEDYLKKRRGALLMVTHDRYFLDRVTTRIIEIDRGQLFSYNTCYSGFLELKAQREEMEVASLRKRRSILREEIEWMQRGARARSTKQKAHIGRYENTLAEAGEIQAHLSQVQTVKVSSSSSRLGRTIIELENISKSYEEKTLINNFSYIFLRDDRVGFVGNNGCGKSTLMNIITEHLTPDSGNITIGATVKIGYFSQKNEYMDENLTAIGYIRETAEYIDTPDGKLSASVMCERFLFNATLQYQKIAKLSGGEKRRLYLLKILMGAPNVLVLDEPTNDLDIATLSILEDYLEHFEGVVITVSHDRYFLDRICTRIFAFEGEGQIRQYEGGYSDYLLSRPEANAASNAANSQTADKKKKSDQPFKKQHSVKIRFTYNEQKEYDSIEEDIEKLEMRISELEAEIPKAATDFVKLTKLTEEKDSLEAELLEKMDRWEYLSQKAAEIEAAKG